jgi:hypothetical protein
MGKLRLSQYLADLEEKYGLVVYIAGKKDFSNPHSLDSFPPITMMNKTL